MSAMYVRLDGEAATAICKPCDMHTPYRRWDDARAAIRHHKTLHANQEPR